MIPRMKIGTNTETLFSAFVKADDRPLNVFVVGRPGTGKSVSIANWYYVDTINHCATVVVDPSGFMAKDLYSLSKGKALYCSLDHPISLNPLLEPYEPVQLINNLIEVVNQVVTITTPNEKFTVKMREIITQVGLRCLEDGRKTIEEIRDRLKNERFNAETKDGIIARLELLLQNPRMKEIICGPGTIDWKEFIDHEQSLILDCFGMSKDEMVFAGTLITHSVKSYFRYRKVKEYKPLIMYIDECHNFVNENYFDILKEGRKYKLCTVLATQDFQSINDRLTRMILSNVGTLIAFNCGHREASALANEFRTIDTSQIQFLEKYHCAFRTISEDGIAKAQRPLFIKPIPIKPMKPKQKQFRLDWFPLEPYHLHETTLSSGEVFADGLGNSQKLPLLNGGG